MLQPRILSVEPISPKKLKIVYETGEQKLFDVAPYIEGSWYGELKEDSYFNSVRVLPGGTGIEWKNGQDIAPHELYEQGINLPVRPSW